MKTCTNCGLDKPLTEFVRNASKRCGYNSHCKECHRALYHAKHYTKEQRRADHFRRKYGIDLTEYEERLVDQHHRCLICGALHQEEPKAARLVVDHNHDTGQVRGLICSRCNVGIGMLNDSPELLLAAHAYLTTRGNYGSQERT